MRRQSGLNSRAKLVWVDSKKTQEGLGLRAKESLLGHVYGDGTSDGTQRG